MTDPDMVLLECEDHMNKTLEHLKHELKGVRTGRASAGLIEFVKVECYGSTTDLRAIAAISAPDPTHLMVKPFDPGTLHDIIKGIERADLGLNPRPEGKVIRVPVPTLSGERRKQLAHQVKTMGENSKIAIRNARRDANKHLEAAEKDKTTHLSEDDLKRMKDEVQEYLTKHEKDIDSLVAAKTDEIMQV